MKNTSFQIIKPCSKFDGSVPCHLHEPPGFIPLIKTFGFHPWVSLIPVCCNVLTYSGISTGSRVQGTAYMGDVAAWIGLTDVSKYE